MKSKFVAISPTGAGFLFRMSSAIAVPTKSAQAVADFLNASRYELKDGETWTVHENDGYYNERIGREIRAFSPARNVKVYRYR